ncbi:outer membrane protein TolC [Arcicella aurantiaca]|uniref:Outer membrane protein TolC n=1 Tax=Arcicella aurantiaca TaxID=591202 RepID=A0A316DER2_9BACT|nr:TolC family protein [Arcicella aurantiaca]PWK16078.1 outer membrane protein TolC [Arcicella aurantiaca]
MLIMVICGFSVSAQTTLQACIELAEKNSPQAQLLPLIKETQNIQIDALNKNLLPQASLGGQATWQSAVTGLPISLPNISMPSIPKDQYKVTLDLTQNIWDGGLTKGQKKLASAAANTDSKSIENNIFQLKEQISNLYFGVLLADKQLANTEISRNDLESQAKKIQANLQNGTAIKGNVLMIEARLIELKQIQREIKSRKLAALKGLSILTGKEFSATTILEEPQNQAIEDANIDRPELKLFDAQKELSEANKSLIKAKYAPKVNLFATGGYGRPALNFLSPDFSTYFIGGLALKIPLSHLYLKTQNSDLRQLDINKEKIDRQKELFLQQTNLKLASQNEDVAKLQDQIKEDSRLIEIREYMKKTAENKLENGIITVSDYISEVDNEATAKQNLSLHQVQLLQIINNIKITKGKM